MWNFIHVNKYGSIYCQNDITKILTVTTLGQSVSLALVGSKNYKMYSLINMCFNTFPNCIAAIKKNFTTNMD